MSEHPHGTLRPDVGEGDHRAGPSHAPVTLVEYGDYQCPHCARAHPIVTEIRKQLGASLQFVFRNFPLTEIHPDAGHAAEATESVAQSSGNDAYWAMHDAIYEHQMDSLDALDDEHLVQYAADIGADAARVQADLDGGTFEERVRADFVSGVRSGVNGTPTFFINGVRFDGNWSNRREFAAALQSPSA
ncbi:MAG: oxidoreductase [Gemmatimonadetes bacterium]|nr:oxidoreductase [Gemmatimonadota bacterium]